MEYSGTMRQTVSSLLGMEKPPKPGARFQFFAQVKDIGENVGESDVVALRVVTPEELKQSIKIIDQLIDYLFLELFTRKKLGIKILPRKLDKSSLLLRKRLLVYFLLNFNAVSCSHHNFRCSLEVGIDSPKSKRN